MKLPNHQAAVIPKVKIVDYLLSDSHPTGKGGFFKRFGFSADSWEVLASVLRQHATEHEVAKIESSPYGTRYIIEGKLESPDGRKPQVRSVWFIDTGKDIPRFISAYPLKRKESEL